jgi:hypothetical protein
LLATGEISGGSVTAVRLLLTNRVEWWWRGEAEVHRSLLAFSDGGTVTLHDGALAGSRHGKARRGVLRLQGGPTKLTKPARVSVVAPVILATGGVTRRRDHGGIALHVPLR